MMRPIHKKTKVLIIVILLGVGQLIFSQNKNEIQVFKAIVAHEIQTAKVYIGCEKKVYSFNKKHFVEQGILDVPENILDELQVSSKTGEDSVWDINFNDSLKLYSFGLLSKQCLSRQEVNELFNSKKKRQRVLVIGRPNFDNDNQNCIVSITYRKYHKSGYGQSYFLQKVYGKWVIIETFDTWMS